MKQFVLLVTILWAVSADAQSYTTNFPATETPISENSKWINGGPAPGTGLAWGNVNSTPHLAFGTTVSGAPPYTDSTAVLTGTWSSNQAACGVVFIDPTLNRSGNFEVEIRLRTTITANNNNGYEVTYSTQSGGGQYAGFARWNGPLNSFTSLGTLNHSIPALANGDVVCGSMVGSTITEWMIHAGTVTVVNTATDSTYTGGSPGMGFWDFGGSLAINKLYGFSKFTAANIMARSCASADVQAALNSVAADNTSVGIPAGTCTWGTLTSGSPGVSYTGTFSTTIQGSANITFTGIPGQATYTFSDDGGTTIIDHVGHNIQDNPSLVLNLVVGKTLRLTGISFIQDSGSVQSFNNIWLQVNGNDGANARIDHVHFSTSQNNSLAFSTNGGWEGVWDHIVGEDLNPPTTPGSGWRDHGTNNTDWTIPGNFGTNANGWRYFESSIFHNFSNDGIGGGRMVYRFNTQFMSGAGPVPTEPLQTHSTASGGGNRAMRAFEVYGNVFQCKTYLCDTGMEMSAGSGVLWGNILTPSGAGGAGCASGVSSCGWTSAWRTVENRYQGTPYAQTATPGGWGYCSTNFNGTGSAWDGSPTTGYPCIDQPGRGAGDLITGNFPNKINSTTGTIAWPHEASEPVYEWMDSWTAPNGFANTGFWGNQATAVIQSNRDYYLDCSPTSASGCTSFNGTVGVGHGTLANRPATCTTGVAYWATDQGTWNQSGNGFGNGQLFKCTNIGGVPWSLYYTPLTYPHPLVGGGTPPLTPAVSVSPSSLSFGTSTSPQTVTATSTGTANLVMGTPPATVTGDFSVQAISGQCTNGQSIAAPSFCLESIGFAPTAIGSRIGTLSIFDNVTGSPQTVALSGTGIATASVSPSALVFGNVVVGQSRNLNVTLQNTGNFALSVTSIAMTGTYYSQTNNCPASLGAGLSCTITVNFAPLIQIGGAAGTLTITDNSSTGSTQMVGATGSGILVATTSTGVTIQGSVIQ